MVTPPILHYNSLTPIRPLASPPLQPPTLVFSLLVTPISIRNVDRAYFFAACRFKRIIRLKMGEKIMSNLL